MNSKLSEDKKNALEAAQRLADQLTVAIGSVDPNNGPVITQAKANIDGALALMQAHLELSIN